MELRTAHSRVDRASQTSLAGAQREQRFPTNATHAWGHLSNPAAAFIDGGRTAIYPWS